MKNTVSILSAMNEENKEQIKALAEELAADYIKPDVEEEDKKIDPSALFKIGYGLYVITSNDGKKDNGFIGNTVAQVSNDPSRIIVGVNKANYSCEIINKTGVLNVCTLNEQAPFQIFQGRRTAPGKARSGRRFLGTNGATLWLWSCLPKPGAPGP